MGKKKRADGRYAKQITIGVKEDGSPKKKTIYGKTIKEMEKNERDYLNLRDRGITTPVEDITVNDLITVFKKHKKPDMSDSSYRTIERDLKKVSRVMGHMKLHDVKVFHVEDMINGMMENHKPSSVRTAALRTKEMFRYALEKDMIYRNPAEFLKMPTLKESQKRMLTKHEKELFDKAELDNLERCFVCILRYTGMRRGEVLALSVSDIDFKKNTIAVNKTLNDGRGKPFIQPFTKTSAGMRSIPIFEPLRPIIEDYCKNRIGLLFTNTDGQLFCSIAITHLWDRILRKLKTLDAKLPEDITPHIFRHTFASDLYEAGIDLKRAQYLLGHGSTRTTLDIYTHFDKDNTKVDEMNEYFRKSKDSQKEKAN